jgi:hypothetical protein
MKCDNCKYQTIYHLGNDEGGWTEVYCKKEHWSGYGPRHEEVLKLPDPWIDCKDFEELPLHEAEEFKL